MTTALMASSLGVLAPRPVRAARMESLLLKIKGLAVKMGSKTALDRIT